MKPRIKKLIGFMALLPALVVYVGGAAALGDRVPDNQLLKVAFYLVAGVAWAFPVKYLMLWMNAEPRAATTAPDRDRD